MIDKQKLKERRKKAYDKWISKEENQKKHKNGIKERSQKSRQWLDTYKKDKKCEICGQSHISTLDFHHKNPNEKDGLVGDFVRSYSIKRLQEEINKCQILCANCHIKKQYNLEKEKNKKTSEAKRILGNKCIKCGEQNSLCLEFHHHNKLEKIDNISNMINTNGWQTILKELEKCELLCRNCHRVLHYNEKHGAVV